MGVDDTNEYPYVRAIAEGNESASFHPRTQEVLCEKPAFRRVFSFLIEKNQGLPGDAVVRFGGRACRSVTSDWRQMAAEGRRNRNKLLSTR
jgi:hypothetical protein